jgi:hypothetical protein
LSLPFRAQVAMCCGCVEHTLPLFELFRRSAVPREALDYAWECAFGIVTPSREQVERLDKAAAGVIRNASNADTQDGELCLRSAVGVLDTLAYLTGVEEAASRVCSAVLDALLLAVSLSEGGGRRYPKKREQLVDDVSEGAPDKRDPRRSLLATIQDGSNIPALVSEEMVIQRQMIDEVRRWTDARLAIVWREEHRRRGRAIAERLGGGLRP